MDRGGGGTGGDRGAGAAGFAASGPVYGSGFPAAVGRDGADDLLVVVAGVVADMGGGARNAGGVAGLDAVPAASFSPAEGAGCGRNAGGTVFAGAELCVAVAGVRGGRAGRGGHRDQRGGRGGEYAGD